jgi:ADP-heptose:LPS heptosyltransferase
VSGRPLVVALRALGLGDLLTGIPALRALRSAFPRHRIVLAAPAALSPLAFLSGAVDEVVDTRPLTRLDPRLDGAHVGVNLHGRGPASHRVLLASRPRRLIAFANDEVPESAGMPEWRADEHEVARWCRLLAEVGVPDDPSDLYLDPPSERVPSQAVGATIVHAGAASPARRWPRERFAAVARAELERGRPVVYTGTAEERRLAADVARLAGGGTVVAGETDLPGLAALVAAAGRLVAGDTGVAHLATALRTPSVLLFGPTSPAHWGPPAADPRHRVLWAGRPADPHGWEPDPGLLAIRVDDVLAALAALDEERAAA